MNDIDKLKIIIEKDRFHYENERNNLDRRYDVVPIMISLVSLFFVIYLWDKDIGTIFGTIIVAFIFFLCWKFFHSKKVKGYEERMNNRENQIIRNYETLLKLLEDSEKESTK